MAHFSASFWVFVFSFLLSLFRYLNRIRSRLIKFAHSQMKNSCSADILPQESDELNSNPIVSESLPEDPSCQIKHMNESNFAFTFKFPSYEEFTTSHKLNCDSVSLDSSPASKKGENIKLEPKAASCIKKYEFQGKKNITSFMEDGKEENFAVKVLYSDAEALSGEAPLNSGEEEQLSIQKDSHSNKVQLDDHERDFLEKADIRDEKSSLVSDSDSDSDSKSVISSHEFSVISDFFGSTSDGFISDADFEEANEQGTLMVNKRGNFKHLDLEDYDLQKLNFGYEPDDFDEEDEDILEEIQKLEESEKVCENDFRSYKTLNVEKEKPIDCTQKQNSSVNDIEDSNRLETLWEHQDLIEQLKMELKKVKATGLPTILEESTDYPKIMEDLKPWKIEEKLQHGDRLGELHKFYKSYRERMRKFDILNYQKMYTIGVLQSKDPFKSFSLTHKSSSPGPTMKSKLKLLCKRKKLNSDPAANFIREMHSDLEMVYVGQLCLSWEFLQWQYEKAFDIWEADPYGLRQYNEVAGEFQHFQVLLQRFIENEPFQGPRVENYVKNRCFIRNLLQVPVIREDNSKERKRRKRGRENGEITSDTLLEILEESIRSIWRFIRADKYAQNIILKGKRRTEIELEDPANLRLLVEIQTEVQKKEKKLKDLQRSGNCILKRFQRHEEEEGTDHLYFFSQVDMKLVTRVLNMSKITSEQLIWCQNKLENIGFVNRKIHLQPSFLLFPC